MIVSGDIVERLRYEAWLNPSEGETADAHYLAADALAEIERLRAEMERLRTALEVAANHMSMTGAPQTTIDAIRNAVRGG